MIIGEISGGLGNQLYKYATAYAVSRACNQKLVLDRTLLDTVDFREYELDGLRIVKDKEISWGYKTSILDRAILNKIRRAIATKGAKRVVETRGPLVYYPELKDIAKANKAIYLFGGWQHYMHFQEYYDEICAMCEPSFELKKETSVLLEKIRACNSVAVHVRRGDYVTLGFTLENDYYEHAITKMQELVPDGQLFVFSDDIEYCESLFKDCEGITYIKHSEKRSTIVDFYLMRNCKHQIMANSSFSWWAAYTNTFTSKIVIAPDGGEKDKIRNNLYPKDWIVL